MKKYTKDSYQIRQAAGLFWIIHMEQKGMPYEEPIPVNEVGADIFRGMLEGRDAGEISRVIAEKYHAPEEEIEQDVLTFMKQLRERGDHS